VGLNEIEISEEFLFVPEQGAWHQESSCYGWELVKLLNLIFLGFD